MFLVSVEVYAVPVTTRVRYTASRVSVVDGMAGSFSAAGVGCISGNGFQDQMRGLVKSGKAVAITTQVVTNLSGSLFRSVAGPQSVPAKAPPSKWRVEVEGTLDARGPSTLVDFDIKVDMGEAKKWLIEGSQLVLASQSLLVGSHPQVTKQRRGEYRVVVVINLKEQGDASEPHLPTGRSR